MRIALVIYGSLERLTGGFLYDRRLVEALRRRGHRVSVISLPWRPYPLCLAESISPGLKRRLTSGAWDLLLQDELTHPSLALMNRRLKRAAGRPIVAIVHQVLCRQPRRAVWNHFFRFLESAYLESVDALIFNSSATRRAAFDLLKNKRPHRVIPPSGSRFGRPPSPDAIAARLRSGGPLELLFVGNISPVKGLEPLVRALAPIPRPGWRLTVAGDTRADPGCTRRARRLVDRLNLAPAVRFTGRLEAGALRDLFQRSHLFVMPFAHEGFGIAALEAMGFGLPVMASTSGGAGEFVRHGENGWLVAPGDLAAVGRHIEALLTARGLLEQMGRSAYDAHRAWPTWEESMGEACLFLESLGG
jgi:glycosyltransferase involved in cell wall biosynthesis